MNDRLEPIPPEIETRHRRHIDVSKDPRYNRATTAGDSECTEAPTRIPVWILTLETQEALFREEHGTAPDLIYARGVPDTPAPDQHTFDKKQCILIIFEIGFCEDFGCHKWLQEKTAKYRCRSKGGVGEGGIRGHPRRPRGHHPQGDATPSRTSPIRHKTRDQAKQG